MQRILAVVLVLLGVGGLIVGRLGDTVWAPPSERTATVSLSDPGAAVVVDPGVLYIGGTEGSVRVEGKGEVSVITAGADDIEAYLGEAKRTRITGLEDWSTLATATEHPDGAAEIPGVAGADLWRSVQTAKSPATIDIAAFHAHETREEPQPYRAILLVTDGKNPGASRVSITWPSSDRSTWVPYAYAGGATLAVIGLVLLVMSMGASRRRTDDEIVDDEIIEHEHEHVGAPEHEHEHAGAHEHAQVHEDETVREADPTIGTGADPGASPSAGSRATDAEPVTDPDLWGGHRTRGRRAARPDAAPGGEAPHASPEHPADPEENR